MIDKVIKTVTDMAPFLSVYPQWVKLLFSGWVLLSASLFLSLIFMRPPATEEKKDSKNSSEKPLLGAMWPQEKSLEALKRRLDRVSKTNRQILKEITDSGRDGLYVLDIERKFQLTRHEIINR